MFVDRCQSSLPSEQMPHFRSRVAVGATFADFDIIHSRSNSRGDHLLRDHGTSNIDTRRCTCFVTARFPLRGSRSFSVVHSRRHVGQSM